MAKFLFLLLLVGVTVAMPQIDYNELTRNGMECDGAYVCGVLEGIIPGANCNGDGICQLLGELLSGASCNGEAVCGVLEEIIPGTTCNTQGVCDVIEEILKVLSLTGGNPEEIHEILGEILLAVRGNGELVCENGILNYGEETCNALGCCVFDNGHCWSEVGSGPCTSDVIPGSGEEVCQNHNYDEETCNAIGCCAFDNGECWSQVGSAPCHSGTTPATPSSPTTPCTEKVTWPRKDSSPVPGYNYYEVFGVAVFAEPDVAEDKVQHMASVLASYIDNDNDGCSDNPAGFLTKLKAAKGSVVAMKDQFFDLTGLEDYYTLTMYNINPQCSGTGASDECRDDTLEEVFHLLTDRAYALEWPEVFSRQYWFTDSNLTRAMDVARGGKFYKITDTFTYPSEAWYHYYASSCGYQCQATEYHFDGISTYLGMWGQMSNIDDFFEPYTKEKLIATDKLMTQILEDTTTGYVHPKVAPTGLYTGCGTCSGTGDKTSHGGTIAA